MLPFDVRDPGSVQAALANLPESWQNIDILINNAGLAKGLAPIQEGSLDHWEQMIDTNIKGLLYVTRAVAPGMVARRRGHIVNIGSSAGKEVYAKGNVYCATKFAVEALTRAIRLDLHAHNIRVSQVSPGHVEETEFAITRFDGDAERARIYNDFQPLKSSDVAEAIYWMATRPPHVNIQDIVMFGTQQASATVIDRSGR
jgi:NADP-dependent 3-hydroxy acid dehydrogenase YdfG